MTTRFRCGARIAGATVTTTLLLIAGQAQSAGAAVSSPGQADGCLRQGSFLDFRCPPDPDGRPVHIESGAHATPSSYHRSRTTEHHAAKAPAERAHVEQATAQGADPAAARAGAPEQAPTTNAAAPVTNAAAPQANAVAPTTNAVAPTTNAPAPTTNAVAPQANAPQTNAVAPAADHPSAQAVEAARATTPDAPAAQAVPQAEASRSAERTPTHHSPAEPTVVNAPPARRPPGRAHTTAKRHSTPRAHKQSPHSPSNRRLPASGA